MDFSNLADEIAAVAHRCWCRRMLEAGWQPGKLLDPEARMHDALRLYADLPSEDRARIRLRATRDQLAEPLVTSVRSALESRKFSARDIYVGMRVRLVDGDPADIGEVVSWSRTKSEPEVLEEIIVQWPNGDVVEYCPAEEEIVPVDDSADL